MPKTCDQQTVGVLVRDARGRLLMITRNTAPAGLAPVAGHADLHAGADHAGGTLADVARAETAEEVGLDVIDLRPLPVAGHWIASWCRRRLPDGAVEHGHAWSLWEATASGELAPDERETRGAAYYTPRQVQGAAERTAAYAAGRLDEGAWLRAPGLEPVWCALLHRLGEVDLAPGALERIAALGRAPGQLFSRA